mgnify:FL=1
MKTELNSKEYVSFARRFVKDTVENMDAKELKDFVINALHEDIQEMYDDLGQNGALNEMIAWDQDIFKNVADDYDLTVIDDDGDIIEL